MIEDCWPEWELDGTNVFPIDAAASVWLIENRSLMQVILYVSIFAPMLIGVAWSVFPIIGNGGKGGD